MDTDYVKTRRRRSSQERRKPQRGCPALFVAFRVRVVFVTITAVVVMSLFEVIVVDWRQRLIGLPNDPFNSLQSLHNPISYLMLHVMLRL